jgi:hypothetical protein
MNRLWLPGTLLVGAIIAVLTLGTHHNWDLIGEVRGQAVCPGDDTKGCDYGGSIRHPDFFLGHANQTGTTVFAAQNSWGVNWHEMRGNQPSRYPVHPPWAVAGVDFGVGIPAALMPTSADLTGRATLKDPAAVDRDPLLNPLGKGENCRFYASNTEARGVMPGTTRAPSPAPFGGPSIVCANRAGSANALIFEHYHFGWNSRTGFGCVPVLIGSARWGRKAADTSMDSARVIIRDSLLVNGPNCNIWGGLGQGPGTTAAGPQAAGLVYMVQLASGGERNSFAFYRNTVFGCGGDDRASDIERALCRATFPSGSYDAIGAGGIAIRGFVQGATPGIAPENAHAIADNQGRNSWIEYNAFVHLAGRAVDYAYVTAGASTHIWAYNYFEGMTYQTQAYATVAAVQRGGDGREIVTTTAPHGVAPGSYASLSLMGGRATGFPPGWNGTWTMQAIDHTHLALTNVADNGNWSWTDGAYPVLMSNFAHGELQYMGGSASGASFNASIDGTTLTVNTMTQGALAPGQYISATTGSGLAIPAGTRIVSGQGNTWTLNRDLGHLGPAAMVNPYYTIGAQGAQTTFIYRYNTYLQPASAKGYGETAVYLTGGQNNGIPFGDFTGSIDHNVFVVNLSTGGQHMQQSVAAVAVDWQSFHNLAITDNYIDPTGAFMCFESLSEEASDGLTVARNVNLLKPDDPWINMFDTYSIIPQVPGTMTNTQAEHGIDYDPATGMVTLTLSFPATFQAGQKFTIANNAVTTGPNYLAGIHTAVQVSGTHVTFAAARGLPGQPAARDPAITLVTDSGKRQACYGSLLDKSDH